MKDSCHIVEEIRKNIEFKVDKAKRCTVYYFSAECWWCAVMNTTNLRAGYDREDGPWRELFSQRKGNAPVSTDFCLACAAAVAAGWLNCVGAKVVPNWATCKQNSAGVEVCCTAYPSRKKPMRERGFFFCYTEECTAKNDNMFYIDSFGAKHNWFAQFSPYSGKRVYAIRSDYPE